MHYLTVTILVLPMFVGILNITVLDVFPSPRLPWYLFVMLWSDT